MAERYNQLAQAICNKETIKQCNVDELQELIKQYPYFSAAQILLYKRLQINRAQNDGDNQLTALHAYQPILLQEEFDIETSEVRKGFQNVPAPIIDNKPEAVEPVVEQKGFENVALPTQESASVIAPDEIPVTTQKGFENVSEEDKLPVDEQMPIAPLVMPKPQEGSLEITFEPFHTVDYFASQGIKLSQTDMGTDNFGKQLKSFTEWLKTMKKMPAAEASNLADAKGESKVVNLAATSLHNTDVLTEAMADVWVKQGNYKKAEELYNKLSLLNPSKKAYFAAKIESLKK